MELPSGGAALENEMRLLGISGSLRQESHNRRLLREAAELLPAGVEFELYDRLKAIPPYEAAARSHLAQVRALFEERLSTDELDTLAELLGRLPGGSGSGESCSPP